jgi:hypothetical protein
MYVYMYYVYIRRYVGHMKCAAFMAFRLSHSFMFFRFHFTVVCMGVCFVCFRLIL